MITSKKAKEKQIEEIKKVIEEHENIINNSLYIVDNSIEVNYNTLSDWRFKTWGKIEKIINS